MGERPRVLVVEDNAELVRILTTVLADEGYQVEAAADGQRGLHAGLTRAYDVIVLDRGLPAIEGVDLLQRWRGRGVTTPVLILSALGNPADRIEGLDAGAEDYLSKPFDFGELLARLRALRRRHLDDARTLPVGDRLLDLDTRQLRPRGATAGVQLSERECALLSVLAGRPARVFSRRELIGLVFADADSEVVVDTYVHYLRRKAGRGLVRTIRGRGFQLGPG
ncbi:response regulator transcription factor [Fodinicola acaciae]|uniref:response regulator transcription factor n=1 Tax=Fodinicola acaciae TaxID=2681555 RepID=UPI0013D2DCCC|nr:response regulator transcription factor [Fodinicola acaciae]